MPAGAPFGILTPQEEAERPRNGLDNMAMALTQALWRAARLPGDVMQGKVSMYGPDGHTNPEVINRSADLAGLVMGGSYAAPAMKDAAGMGIRAYHGSPHNFDAFDLSKINTGEGAQAYGHGLYFAENEGTAKAYQEALAGKVDNPQRNQQLSDLAREMSKYEVGYRKYNDPRGYELAKQYDDIMAARSADKGKMYEVDINADPSHFLDWDKPLSGQPPIVQDLARNADLSHLAPGNRTRRQIEMWRDGTLPNAASEPNGNVLHSALTDYGMDAKNNAALTERFREAGIPGIKYLDQGSRAAGEGSRNYVVFDDKLINIARKYGIAGLLGAPVAGAAMSNRTGD